MLRNVVLPHGTELRLVHVLESLTADANQIIIDDPTLADDVTIRTRTNAPNGLTKLDASGKVPASLLPFTGLEFLGSYNPALGTPAPGTPGQFYVFSADGTITLLDEDGNPKKRIPIVLPTATTLAGRVVDPAGAPVVGAKLAWSTHWGYASTSTRVNRTCGGNAGRGKTYNWSFDHVKLFRFHF